MYKKWMPWRFVVALPAFLNSMSIKTTISPIPKYFDFWNEINRKINRFPLDTQYYFEIKITQVYLYKNVP